MSLALTNLQIKQRRIWCTHQVLMRWLISLLSVFVIQLIRHTLGPRNLTISRTHGAIVHSVQRIDFPCTRGHPSENHFFLNYRLRRARLRRLKLGFWLRNIEWSYWRRWSWLRVIVGIRLNDSIEKYRTWKGRLTFLWTPISRIREIVSNPLLCSKWSI